MAKKPKAAQEKKPSIEKALSLIENSDLRLTGPRRRLLQVIFSFKGPFSAPSLEKKFAESKSYGTCDPVTIYRTLPVFEELGIIERCDFSDGMACYELNPHLGSDAENHHHHHHIVCKSCRKIEKLDFCILEGQEQVLQKFGYTNLTHRLEFLGICPSCSS